MDIHIFENLFTTLLQGLGSDFFGKAANIINAVAPLFAVGFGIYVMIVAFNAYNRGMDEYILDMMLRVFGWLVIIACAFNASQYVELAQILYTLPEFLSEAVSGQPYNGNIIDGEIGKFMDAVTSYTSNAVKNTEWDDFGTRLALNIFGFALIVLGFIFFGVVAAFYLVAKISLAMVLLTGPIFIGAMLFPATRQWGMNWIGQIMSYSVMVMFYVVVAAVQLGFYRSNMQLSTDALASTKVLTPFIMLPLIGMFFFATFVFLVVVWNVPTIATALTGGASISGFSGVYRGAAAGTRMAERGGEMAKNGASRTYGAVRNAYRSIRGNKIRSA